MRNRCLLLAPLLLLSLPGCRTAQPPAANPAFASANAPSADNVCAGATVPSQVWEEADVLPELIGSLRTLLRRLEYPQSAKRERVQGVVFVRFVVDERGCVVQPEIVQRVDPRLDAEALRVVRTARFEPGQKTGETVAVKMAMPFSFRLR